MVVAEWIGDVTERVSNSSLAACAGNGSNLPLVSCTVQYLLRRSFIQLLSYSKRPLSPTFSCPFIPLPSSTSTLTRIDSGPTFYVTPWCNCRLSQGTSAQLFRHGVYYYRLRPCPRPHARYNLGYLALCSHFQQPPPPLLTASHESLDQTFFYSEEPSQLGRISAGAVEES
jgi:hypothetical protein